MMIGKLGEMLEVMKSGIYDFTVDGHCSGCGSCCGNFLPLLEKDIKRIKKYIKKHGVKEQIRNAPTASRLVDMMCPFRSEKEKKCMIYEIRPVICRDFQCDRFKDDVPLSKDLYHGKIVVVDMRKTFFRKENK